MVSLWYLYGILMVFIWDLNGIYIGAITEARRDCSLPFALEKGTKKLRAISDTQLLGK